MESKAKTKTIWSHPEFYFGMAGFLAFWIMPYIQVKSSAARNFFMTGFEMVSGSLPPKISEKAMLVYDNSGIVTILLVIPLICLGLIFFSATDFPRMRRMLSMLLFTVTVGFTIYFQTDFLHLNPTNEIARLEFERFYPIEEDEEREGESYSNITSARIGKVTLVSGFWITLFLSFLSIFSTAIARMFVIPEAKAVVVPVAPPKETPDDPFWD
jgi:hypothetical protein